MITVAFIMGTTCSGKSTFLQYAQGALGSAVHLIEVGKEMRKRHPPEYFQGKMALPETEVEAMDIFFDQFYQARMQAGVGLILVDGQPRTVTAAKMISEMNFYGIHKHFTLFHADEDDLHYRVLRRDLTNESRQLSLDRIKNDKIGYFDVLAELLSRGHRVDVVQTGEKDPACYHRHVLQTIAETSGIGYSIDSRGAL